jgi:Zn-dependent M28 family amino/carboxypeptidase
MRRILAACLRIAAGVAVLLVVALLAIFVAFRRPSWKSLPRLGSDLGAEPGRLRGHVAFLCGPVMPRDSEHPGNLDGAATYVTERFSETGGRVSSQQFTARRAEYRNIVSRYGPESGPLWVVGAHYDAFGSTGPMAGADDDASGVAGLLELGRLLGRRPPAVRVELVAFANEEPPFFGSQDMGSAVHARSLAGTDIRGMICLEMIGYFTERQPWPSPIFRLLYPSRGDFIGVSGRSKDAALAGFVKAGIRGAAGIPVYSLSAPEALASDASDHRSYWDRGITAVMVTDTAYIRNPNYHTRFDTPATLDYDRMARVVDGIANTLWHATPSM